jgi:hypothetical protein
VRYFAGKVGTEGGKETGRQAGRQAGKVTKVAGRGG